MEGDQGRVSLLDRLHEVDSRYEDVLREASVPVTPPPSSPRGYFIEVVSEVKTCLSRGEKKSR